MNALLLLVLLTPSPSSGPPSRSELLRRSFRPEELLVVYGSESSAEDARFRAALESARTWRARAVRVVPAAAVHRDEIARGAVALVGTPRSNRWIAEMARALPVEPGNDGFRFAGRAYTAPGDAVALVYPNPLCPDSPLYLVSGNSDEAVLDTLGRRRRNDVQIRENGRTRLLARFADDWTIEAARLEEFSWPDAPVLVTRDFEYFATGPNPAALQEFARHNETTRARIEARFGAPSPERSTRIYVYPSLETKGLVLDDTRSAQREGNELHVVLGLDRDPERLVARTFLESVLGHDVPPVLLDGLASVLGDEPEALDELDRTALALSATSAPPSPGDLDGASPLAVEAVSASFARFVLDELGPQAFRETRDLGPLETRWHAALAKKRFSPEPFPSVPESFQRGFTYSQEGFDIHDGYLSAASDRSLDALARLGVDSIAVVPYAFMSGPSATELSIPDGPGGETDEGVAHVLGTARGRGMTVLLKPQIWVRRSWPGAIDFSSTVEEERFFDAYRRWMLHFALLAERHRVPLLSIGCELTRLTRGHRAFWERLIRDVRAVYRGKLVYAANWGEEVERGVDFWPLLDFIGVDFYYPLSDEDAPTDEALRRGFTDALARLHSLAERYGKPVLLTEIGYASTRAPWKSPHTSDTGGELRSSPESQARSYDAALSVVAGETQWIRGMYWWKWPSDPDRGGPSDRGFTPKGKPAEDVVRRWYRDAARLQ